MIKSHDIKDRKQVLRDIRNMIRTEKFKNQKEVVSRYKEKFPNETISQSSISRYFRTLAIEEDPNTGYYVCTKSNTNEMSDVESLLYHTMRYSNPDISSSKSSIKIFTDKPLENVISEAVSAVYGKYIKGIMVGKGIVIVYITNKNDASISTLDKTKQIKQTLLSFKNSLDVDLEDTFEI